MRKIELRNGLPTFPGDDVEYLCTEGFRRLKKSECRGAGTITDIVRVLGLEDRTAGGAPTTVYLRVRCALRLALKLGRVRKHGRIWALEIVQEAKAS